MYCILLLSSVRIDCLQEFEITQMYCAIFVFLSHTKLVANSSLIEYLKVINTF